MYNVRIYNVWFLIFLVGDFSDKELLSSDI